MTEIDLNVTQTAQFDYYGVVLGSRPISEICHVAFGWRINLVLGHHF